jgi:hypothetical protein
VVCLLGSPKAHSSPPPRPSPRPSPRRGGDRGRGWTEAMAGSEAVAHAMRFQRLSALPPLSPWTGCPSSTVGRGRNTGDRESGGGGPRMDACPPSRPPWHLHATADDWVFSPTPAASRSGHGGHGTLHLPLWAWNSSSHRAPPFPTFVFLLPWAWKAQFSSSYVFHVHSPRMEFHLFLRWYRFRPWALPESRRWLGHPGGGVLGFGTVLGSLPSMHPWGVNRGALCRCLAGSCWNACAVAVSAPCRGGHGVGHGPSDPLHGG